MRSPAAAPRRSIAMRPSPSISVSVRSCIRAHASPPFSTKDWLARGGSGGLMAGSPSVDDDTDVSHAEVERVLDPGGGRHLKPHVQEAHADVGGAGALRPVPALHVHVREEDVVAVAVERVEERAGILFL